MNEDNQVEVGEESKLSEAFHKNFKLPEKRNSLGLYEVYHASGEKVFQCKSLTKLTEWCYKAEEALKMYYKQQQQIEEN